MKSIFSQRQGNLKLTSLALGLGMIGAIALSIFPIGTAITHANPIVRDSSNPQNPNEKGLQRRKVTPHEIIIVDAGVKETELLLANIVPNIEVYHLSSSQNGLDQISQILSQQNNVTAIHFIAHGQAGELQLGNAVFSQHTLKAQAAQIQQWRSALTATADILIYGCNLAQGPVGKTLIRDLQVFTGADVAASSDVTGNTAQGGNWDLEYRLGQINTQQTTLQLAQSNYPHTLQTTTLNFSDATPTRISGSSLSQGAVYRFDDVAPGVDALVTIAEVSNATLTTLDENSTQASRFQPVIRHDSGPNTTSYIRFDFQLITSISTNLLPIPTSVSNVYISTQDTDGNGTANSIREFVELVNGQFTYIPDPTFLVSAPSLIGGERYIQSDSNNNQIGIGDDDRYEAYGFLGSTVSSFSIMGGSSVGSNDCDIDSCLRQNSYSFDSNDAQQLDFGDAPTTYENAAHAVSDTIQLQIGTLIDGDNAPFQTTSANGDDLENSNDEASITFGALTTADNSYNLNNISVTNNTSETAYLVGWIDFNRNGTFDTDEFARASVTNGGTTIVNLEWSDTATNPIPDSIEAGSTYARFRLTTDSRIASTTTAEPTGVASNGEVEDYQFVISNPVQEIRGRVFEDINYGGGAGRNFTAADASAVSSGWSSGAIGSGSSIALQSTVVELYKRNLVGIFVKVAETVTDSNGNYKFVNPPDGTYRVRVINSTVRSARPGYVYGVQIPVQTFRYDPDEATEIGRAVINEVGGRKPSVIDPSTQLLIGNSLPSNAQSYTEIVINGNSVSGADFGFNFNTIVNTNNAGQGSLRQFVLNSNTLTNFKLNQDESANSVASAVTKNAGVEHSIFMIPNASDPLGRPADSGYTSASGLDGGSGSTFQIALTAGELIVTASKTAIDGRTQTALTGDTNFASTGTSTGPEVVITGSSVLGLNLSLDLLTIAGEDVLVDSIGLVKAKNLLNGVSALGRGLVIGGVNLLGVTDPILIRNSTIADNDTNGILISSITANAGSSIQITNNVIRDNGRGTSILSGIGSNLVGLFGNGIALVTNGLSLSNGSIENVDILNNTITDNNENGIKVLLAAAPNILVSNLNIQGNTIDGNGTGGTTASDGISIESLLDASSISLLTSKVKDSQIINNQISNNQGDGVSLDVNLGLLDILTSLLFNPISDVTISRNRIYANGDLGIDLAKSTLVFPQSGVTANDDGDGDFGPNGFLNFPVIEEARVEGQNLILRGWAPPGATIELFLADAGSSPNPLPSGYTKSFGEGQAYLLSLQEGGDVNGISDTDSTQSIYTDDGTGSTKDKTENRFNFTIPLSGGTLGGGAIANGTRLTATSTVNSSTSEFSGVTVVSTTSNFADLLIAERITAINRGQSNEQLFDTTYIDVDSDNLDNYVNWPPPIDGASGISQFLAGAVDQNLNPGDEVEYTVYFISAGDKAITNVNICSMVPANTTYVAGSMERRINSSATALTDTETDTDGAQFVSAPIVPAVPCPESSNEQGAIVINVAQSPETLPHATAPGNPTDSYGYIRFRVTVD